VSGDSAVGAVTFPAGAGSVALTKTITWTSSATKPGQFISLTLSRNNAAGGTCSGDGYLWSALVRY